MTRMRASSPLQLLAFSGSFVSKMDSYPDGREYGSRAKRQKLDVGEAYSLAVGPMDAHRPVCDAIDPQHDSTEGIPTDCDSGYEASTLESLPTPSHHHPSSPNRMDSEHFSSNSSSPQSESFPTLITHADTSQDSVYPEEVEEEEEEEEEEDNVSTVSEISGLSDLSGQEWKPMAGSMMTIQKQIQNGVNPRNLLSELGVDLDQIPQYVDEMTLWKLIINMLAEPPRRNKLRHVNTLDDVVRLLRGAQNIIVLTGAGVSVSCGIPDFRSRDGIYSRLAIDFPDLPDPQAMFDINYFSQDPRPFFKFARDIYPGKFQPSPCHRFIKLLERQKKLLRNYTQNIDTLERVAQIERVVECHGSFSNATCTKCGHKVTADEIRDTVLAQKIPVCAKCQPDVEAISTEEKGRDFRALVQAGIMKPDIVFFGEGLPDLFHEAMAEDKSKCDLLLVIGSSLKVRPVALIPSSLPPTVPQILINREPLPHCHFDVELLGDCDVIINHLCQILDWDDGIYNQQKLTQADHLLPLQEGETSLPSPPQEQQPPTEQPKQQQTTETEPNSSTSFYQQLNIKRQEGVVVCNCNNPSTNNKSSSSLESSKSGCACAERSISTKERHMSVDSARDSGIGDNSNFTDVMVEEHHRISVEDESSSLHDLRGFWQPKVKRSLVDRLPCDSFYLVPPSRYIFPGAEVFYDPDDEKLSYEDSSSDSLESSESECETVEATF